MPSIVIIGYFAIIAVVLKTHKYLHLFLQTSVFFYGSKITLNHLFEEQNYYVHIS